MNEAVQIFNFGDFERTFGGLDVDSETSYAIQQFFLNGGSQAWVVRTAAVGGDGGPALATTTLQNGADVLVIDAANEGTWGNSIKVTVDYNTRSLPDDSDTPDPTLFNLTITDGSTNEVFRNLNMDSSSSSYAVETLNDGSQLVEASLPAIPPAIDARPTDEESALLGGLNGTLPGGAELSGNKDDKTGLFALLDVDLFNILCIPDTMFLIDTEAANVIAEATKFCNDERAFYIVDIPQQDGDRDDFTEVQNVAERQPDTPP